MKRVAIARAGALMLTTAALGLGVANAQQNPAPVGLAAAPPPATPVRLTLHPVVPGRFYWVEGGGGNSGVIIGTAGVIVIDAKTTEQAGRALVAEIAKLTIKPVTHVVLTHSDGDHVNGLSGFPRDIKIISHINAKAEILATFQYAAAEVGGGRCLPPRDRLPNLLIFKNRVDVTLQGVRFVFHHFGAAHTTGDLVVELPQERVVFTGDLLTTTLLVHPEKGGTFDGWFNSARRLLALNVDRYLGGHATDFDTKASMRMRVDDNQAIRDKVGKMVADGMTLAETKVAMGDPPKDFSGCRGIPYPSLAEIEYHSRVSRSQELK